MSYNVAVVGATGNVGREVLNIMAERDFPADQVWALASSRSIGKEVSYGEDKTLKVDSVEHFDFSKCDIAFFAAGSAVSRKYVPIAVSSGCKVIDKSSEFRMKADVPLVVPEINGDLVAGQGLIANPNCVALPLSMTLKPLQDEVGIKRVVVSTYQSVSGAGKEAMDELFDQTRAVYINQPLKREVFPKNIAFNVIPHIDVIDEVTGITGEERKTMEEVKKILGLPDLGVAVTSVRVPVFIGHSMAVTVELEDELSPGEARTLWRAFPGISVVDMRADEGYVTPEEAAGEDSVFISRIRKDPSVTHGLQYWAVCDNLRKGAALNAVQIAELV